MSDRQKVKKMVLNKTRPEYNKIRLIFEGVVQMPIDERKTMSSMTNVIQNIILENREKLNISGVLDVLSFDDQVVMVETELRTPHNKRRKFENK